MMRSHLSRLAAPLRFLAQRDFRALGRVRGLTGLLEASLKEARASGAPDGEVRLLSDALEATQGASLEAQTMALRRLAACVQAQAAASPQAAPAPAPVAVKAVPRPPARRTAAAAAAAPRVARPR